MSRSSQHRDRRGNNGELCQDDINDGTSTRTRPFSFEDMMLKQKSKNAAGEINSGHVDADNKEESEKKAADGLQSDRDGHGKSRHGISRLASKDSLKVSSKEREDNTSMTTERKLAKDRGKESQDDTTKSKLAPVKRLTYDNARGGKSDKHVDHKRRSDRPNEDSKYESGERHSRDSFRRDISTGKSIRKSENEREFKESNENDDRPVNKRRNVDQLRHDYESELHKRHSRSFTGSEKNGGGHRAQSEKERKKKHHDEEREKIEDRDGVKKLDLRTSKVSESSERKGKESSRMHYEESGLKRRRSRSREHDDDRGRRSSSLSPKAHKHTSFTEQEHGGFSSHSSKDKSQRSHFDVERKRISSNGSNSYRRHSGSSSGLGGYSPRKRKTEAAARTSSPSNHSPGRRTAGWDLPPVGKDGNGSGTLISGMQSSSQIMSSNALEPSVVPETSFIVKPVIMPQYTSSDIHAIDSIQLTQATWPMRRLYVENLPASSSKKALMECINSFLLSSGVNHIHGTLPCISCMVHKEKGQALLEFLTPEDASAALSFDGSSFSGSILKIRRPKDFIEVTDDVAFMQQRYFQPDDSSSVSSRVMSDEKALFVEAADGFEKDCVFRMDSESSRTRPRLESTQSASSAFSNQSIDMTEVEKRVDERVKAMQEKFRKKLQRFERFKQRTQSQMMGYLEMMCRHMGLAPPPPLPIDEDSDDDDIFSPPDHHLPSGSGP